MAERKIAAKVVVDRFGDPQWIGWAHSDTRALRAALERMSPILATALRTLVLESLEEQQRVEELRRSLEWGVVNGVVHYEDFRS